MAPPMSHRNQTREELKRLYFEQDIIAEMSDEDIEDYEARLFNILEG